MTIIPFQWSALRSREGKEISGRDVRSIAFPSAGKATHINERPSDAPGEKSLVNAANVGCSLSSMRVVDSSH